MRYKEFWGRVRARLALAETWRGARRIWVPANYGFIALITLCALTVITLWLGFTLDRSASPPATVPVPPSVFLSFAPGSTPPANLSVYTFLEQAPAPVKLIVTASGVFAKDQSSASWTLDIKGFTGYLCPGQAPLRLTPFTGQGENHYYIAGMSAVSQLVGTPFLTVRLCWDRGAPLIASGSYISAALSPVLASSGLSGTVTRSLVAGTSLASYALAGGISPTEESSQAWAWSSSLGGEIQNQSGYAIPIVASSLVGIAQDNQNAFYAGILFGIAGGAGVSMIPALLDAVDRHKSRKKPAPAGAPPAEPHSAATP